MAIRLGVEDKPQTCRPPSPVHSHQAGLHHAAAAAYRFGGARCASPGGRRPVRRCGTTSGVDWPKPPSGLRLRECPPPGAILFRGAYHCLRDARKPRFDGCAARGAAACRGGRPRPLQLCSMSPSACEERAVGPGLEVWWLSGGPVRGQDYRRVAGQVEPPSKVERTQTSQGRRTSATTDLEQSLMVSVPRCGLRPGWPALVAAGQGWVAGNPLCRHSTPPRARTVPPCGVAARPMQHGDTAQCVQQCVQQCAGCGACAVRAVQAGLEPKGRRAAARLALLHPSPLGVATPQPAVPLASFPQYGACPPPQCALVVQHCCACYV